MPENSSPAEISYEIEAVKPGNAKKFISRRTARVSAIVIGAAIAVAASFGLGVAAGLQIAEHNQSLLNKSGQFGPGPGPGPGFGDGDHKFPGGPDGDNDHGGFQVPNSTAPVNPNPAPSTTP